MASVQHFTVINILHELLNIRETLLCLCIAKKETCPAFDKSLYTDYLQLEELSEVNDREIKADATTQEFLWNVVCVFVKERQAHRERDTHM